MKSKLTEKHFKALELLKTGELSLPKVGKLVGFSETYMKDLSKGKGNIGQLFQAELKKGSKELEEKTQLMIVKTRAVLIKKLSEWANNINTDDIDSRFKQKMVVDAIKVLTTTSPMVNIESNSWYTNLQGSDLVNEFKRIKALAKGTAVRERVSETPEGGTGEVPVSPEAGDSDGKGLQDTQVPSKRKAARFSL